MAVWAKIVAVFGKIFWGGFWRVWAPKVAVSDFDLLETLKIAEKSIGAPAVPPLLKKN